MTPDNADGVSTPNTMPGGVTVTDALPYAMPSKGRIVFLNRPQPKHGDPLPADDLVLPAIVTKASGGMINAMAFLPDGGFEFHTGVEHVNGGAGNGVATWAWPPRA